MEKTYLLIFVLVILVLILPIFVKVKISYNFLTNLGGVGIYIFNVKIKDLLFKFSGKEIKIYEDESYDDIEFSGNEKILLEKFLSQIKQKIKLKELNLIYNIGINDAFSTAILCGCVNLFLNMFFTQIKMQKPTSSWRICENISYNQTVFDVAINMKVVISLFEIVYSFLNSVILVIKDKNNYKT